MSEKKKKKSEKNSTKEEAGKDANKEEGDEKEEDAGEDNAEDKEDAEFPRGTVIHLKGLKESEISREDIKAAVEKLGIGVAFVDFSKGLDEAWLRLDSKGAAIEVGLYLLSKKNLVTYINH